MTSGFGMIRQYLCDGQVEESTNRQKSGTAARQQRWHGGGRRTSIKTIATKILEENMYARVHCIVASVRGLVSQMGGRR